MKREKKGDEIIKQSRIGLMAGFPSSSRVRK